MIIFAQNDQIIVSIYAQDNIKVCFYAAGCFEIKTKRTHSCLPEHDRKVFEVHSSRLLEITWSRWAEKGLVPCLWVYFVVLKPGHHCTDNNSVWYRLLTCFQRQT